MKKTSIYFVRHGQVHNPKRVLYGRLPRFGISKSAREKIEQTASRLVTKDISAVFSSPLLRARQTSFILAQKFKLSVRTSSLLIEIKKNFDGVSLQEYEKNIQPFLYSGKNIGDGQETIELIAHRMTRFVQYAYKRFPGKTIVAVSHGDPIMILRATTAGRKFTWNYKKNHYVKTGEWLELEYNGKDYHWL
jgi:broad specificity phosphatase PhoE